MEQFELSNIILEKGVVVEDAKKSMVEIQLPDGTLKEISAYSAESTGHHCHLKKGEDVIFVFNKKIMKRTAGIRHHVLKTIIYPHDKEYLKVLELEKDPSSKTECRVEIEFPKKEAS
jgi:hypothetical protein